MLKKKLISLLMAAVMVFTVLPVGFIVANAETIENSNVTWEIKNSKILVISGTGTMPDYSPDNSAPWMTTTNKRKIESVEIGSGVTNIGDYAFNSLTKLKTVTFVDSEETPSEVATIGDYVFYGCSALESVALPDSVKAIGEYAFAFCTKLTDITGSADISTEKHTFWGSFINLNEGGSRSVVYSQITTLNTSSNPYTVLKPDDVVLFLSAGNKYNLANLTVTYYPDADVLLQSEIRNKEFFAERFESFDNKYKDVLASSESGAAFFRDVISKESATDVVDPENAAYTIKSIGDLSDAYCNGNGNHGQTKIDFSYSETINGETAEKDFLGWVVLKSSINPNKIDFYALWDKSDRASYTINCLDKEGNNIGTKLCFGFIGETVTVEPLEISGYTVTAESQTITLSEEHAGATVTFEGYEITSVNTDPVEPQPPEDEPAVPEIPDDGFVGRLKKKLIKVIIDLLCKIEPIREALDEALIDELPGLTVRSLFDMVIELGVANLIITLIPSLKDIIVSLVVDLL